MNFSRLIYQLKIIIMEINYTSSLKYSLQEAKAMPKSLGKNRIIHMLIDNYKINNVDYVSYQKT